MPITPNENQLKCINAIEGPVMVLAGPGTGKTFTIIHRIKHMLENNILPEEILCLTYSEAAANEMKARLIKEIGTNAAAVTVNTYHAFCNEIIQNYPHEFELLDGVSIVDDITKRNIMREVIDNMNITYYKTKWGDSYYYIPELLDAVDEIKSNRITKEKYFDVLETHPLWTGKMNDLTAEYNERQQKGKLVPTFIKSFEAHKKKMGKAQEAWNIYEAYDIALKKNNLIDFNDMIVLVLDTFDYNSDLLKEVASKYKYFLVDEYQDTNFAQNSIVYKLAEGSGCDNVFVVGDDDQIIYEFQGARTDTLEKFLLHFPSVRVICLNENNRSTQNILDFSYNVISQDKTRLVDNKNFAKYKISKRLTAKNEDIVNLNKKIQLHSFADITQENNFTVSQIENLINSSDFPKNNEGEKDLSKIAVLTRENSELSVFAKLLEAKNIQYQIKSNKSIFEISSSILIYFYLKMLDNHLLYADKLFALLISEPFKFDLEDYKFLLEQSRLNHKDLISNITLNFDSYKWNNKYAVMKFLDDFNFLKKVQSSENVKNLIIETINRTGILNYFVNCEINRIDNIYAIKKIIDEAENLVFRNPLITLSEFISHIDSAFESSIPILIDKEEYTQNAVQLLTMHSSKGREFDYVFIPNLTAKKWEGKRITRTMSLPIVKDTDNKDLDQAVKSEQLRLLFVGITRAKHYLSLSFSNSTDGNPQELTAYISNAVNENEDLVETFNHELSKNEYAFEIVSSLTKCKYDYKTAFHSEIKAGMQNFILSPSSMNAYISCPRCFLYSEVLKIPVYNEDLSAASYGSAIHKSLDYTFKYAMQTLSYPSKDKLLSSFKSALDLQKFDSPDKRKELEERGFKSLDNFYKDIVQTPISRLYSTELYLSNIPLEKYKIKGIVDRIEKNSDGTFELYDYKTGSAKAKSKITDGGEYEHYLNQLRFYKLALELLNPNFKVSRAGIIFVEEPMQNFYTPLSDTDNEIIKEKILYVYKNIEEMNYNPVEKNDDNCKYCAYKQMCNLNLF